MLSYALTPALATTNHTNLLAIVSDAECSMSSSLGSVFFVVIVRDRDIR